MLPPLRRAVLLLTAATAGLAGPPAADVSGQEGDSPQGMVLVPAGEFTMGRAFETADDKTGMRPLILRDDRPAHAVRLAAYWMDATEVTHVAYREFVEATGHRAPYHWPDGKCPQRLADYPIYNVDWGDASAYCRWQGKRLPTEAEWERAARGGEEGGRYPWGDGKPDSEKARFSTQLGPGPVGQYPANGFGLRDMAGGQAEWCQDWFDRTYYADSPEKNPAGPPEGLYKIVRGGAWSDGPNRVTVHFRNWVRPTQRTPNLGFRCVRDASHPSGGGKAREAAN